MRNRRHGFWWLLFVVILVACNPNDNKPTPAGVLGNVPSLATITGTVVAPIPGVPTLHATSVSLGEEIYIMHCAECHGANLEGEADWQQQNEDGAFRAPPHDETGHTWHHPDAVLIESIVEGGARLPDNIGGTSNMPAFGELLTESEIKAVLDYIKSSWPDDIRAIQAQQTQNQP